MIFTFQARSYILRNILLYDGKIFFNTLERKSRRRNEICITYTTFIITGRNYVNEETRHYFFDAASTVCNSSCIRSKRRFFEDEISNSVI